jgi:hypothetical protein
MTTHPKVTDLWGPLDHPIRTTDATGEPPWRDNSYMAFWSRDLRTFGCLHASTSPNAPGRRTRFSLWHDGTAVELVEEPAAGTFVTDSVRFVLGERIEVDSPRLSGELSYTPHLALAEYSDRAIPTIEGGTLLSHVQRAGCFIGSFVLDGKPVSFEGFGFRDRTWGSRDESISIAEYIGVMAVFETYGLTTIRMRSAAGVDHTEGFVVREREARPLVAMTDIVRDGSGLYHSARYVLADGDELHVTTTRRPGGFWVPLGWLRSGPVLSAYDEYTEATTSTGETGVNMIEQGVLKTL